MKGYIDWMDNNPRWLKVVLAIFFIFWWLYRIFKSAEEKNTLGVVLGILLIFVSFIVFIVDIITTIVMDKVLWL